MDGLADNRITPADAARVYEILGFGERRGEHTPPASLDLTTVFEAAPLLALFEQARTEHEQRERRSPLAGLTEHRVGVELVPHAPRLRLTEVKRGRPNHAGREVDRTRTVVGTIHTHPWDVSQSIGDVRNLIRTNDLLGGVVTHTGRLFLLVKHPDARRGRRGPFEQELRLQWASFKGAPETLGAVGLLGALSASFDLPIHATRAPYIRALARRLGLISYAGDLDTLRLQRE